MVSHAICAAGLLKSSVAAGCLALVMAGQAIADPAVDAATLALARQMPTTGWATMEGSVKGGAAATDAQVYVVTNREELVAALGGDNATNRSNTAPALIFVSGTIDMMKDASGKELSASDFAVPGYDYEAYLKTYDPAVYGMDKEPAGPLEQARKASQEKQAAYTVINVGSNKTIFGLGAGAGLVHGTLNIKGASNIIIRNLTLADSYDLFPAWDGTDGSKGNWNSEYDLITVSEAQHVWIDHCTFTDGDHPDADEPTIFGRHVQHHDGAVDVVHASDFVTLGWNHIQGHDKTDLIGNSDKRETDRGHLTVTIEHNWYENSGQRSPRVRYGHVHVFNNLYSASADSSYEYFYSLGAGKESAILSENNVFEMPDSVEAGSVIGSYKGTVLKDEGSSYNGAPVDLVSAYNKAHPDKPISEDIGWTPPYAVTLDPVEGLADKIRSGAGAGKILQ